MNSRIWIVLYFPVMVLLSTVCSQDSNEEPVISNSEPVYGREIDYISLEKSHSISSYGDDYNIKFITSFDVDDNDNLYILGQIEDQINIFNNQRIYIKTIVGTGEWPHELLTPVVVRYCDDQLYVAERYTDIKLWDIHGNYIRKILSNNDTMEMFVSDAGIFCFNSMGIDDVFLRKFALYHDSHDLDNGKTVFTFTNDMSKNFFFNPQWAWALDTDNTIYFPGNPEEYRINKYDQHGTLLLSFGRNYQRKSFSEETKEYYKSTYWESIESGRLTELPRFPPVVSNIMVDSKDKIWVTAGENNIATLKEITIDIFDKTGNWLYTFETDKIIQRTLIRNNKLYTVTNIHNLNDPQYIHVYDIHYAN